MKSFKNYIAEEHPTWHVTFKSDGHEPQKVKGRNTAEAIKKAEKRAQAAHKNPKQIPMYKSIKKVSEEVEIDEAVGTAAKYAGKTGFMGGKYSSHDRMMDMKNFNKVRDKRAAQRNAEHEKQDPKMAKMGYAKHMLDTDKAKAKAAKRGVTPKFDDYKKRNGIRESVELTEADIAEILRQYALSENVNADQLAALSEEEINEIIGKAIGGAFKLGAKAVVGGAKAAIGAGKMVKKAANRVTTAGRADAAEKKADNLEKKQRDRERIQAAKDRVKKAQDALRNKVQTANK